MTHFPRDPSDSDDAVGQQMLDIAAHIHRSGFMLMMVGGGECTVPGCRCEPSDERWSYSIGLVERGLPEVVITGLADVHALHVANFVFDEYRAGRGMGVGEVRWMGSAALRLDDVGDDWLAADTSRMAHWFNHYCVGRAEVQLPPVRQIVWGDAAGCFPDDPRCDPTIAAWQPLLADDPWSFPSIPGAAVEEPNDDQLADAIRRMFPSEQHPSRDRRRRQ